MLGAGDATSVAGLIHGLIDGTWKKGIEQCAAAIGRAGATPFFGTDRRVDERRNRIRRRARAAFRDWQNAGIAGGT